MGQAYFAFHMVRMGKKYGPRPHLALFHRRISKACRTGSSCKLHTKLLVSLECRILRRSRVPSHTPHTSLPLLLAVHRIWRTPTTGLSWPEPTGDSHPKSSIHSEPRTTRNGGDGSAAPPQSICSLSNDLASPLDANRSPPGIQQLVEMIQRGL